MAREYDMSTLIDLRAKVDDYLAERHRLGFELRNMALILASFARYAEHVGHQGPLTIDVMADWARQDNAMNHTLGTWARRLKALRPFTHWLRQFEPRTEVPDASIFGPVPGRVAPHIYRDAEIVALLAAAHGLNPQGGLRPATFETLFGLIASAGLRVSEALSLLDTDVDLADGTLMVRQTKFAKSRLLPLHPSTVKVLVGYRQLRSRQVQTTADTPFFVGTRGHRLGQPLGNRQVHRVFNELRDQLGWVDRGAHGNPRIHDLRHSFAVRRLILWHEQGIDVDQAMLTLSTYLGHAKISNTYWYLTGVPELMTLAGSKFECFVEAAGADDE
jgi:integrase